MSAYILDTNVVCETSRIAPDKKTEAWIRKLKNVKIPAIVVLEIKSGIYRASGGKRRFLEEWFGELLAEEIEVVAFDKAAALAAVDIEREARHQRRTIETRDLLILATAKANGLRVATRNVAHFRGLGVAVYDPFNDIHVI